MNDQIKKSVTESDAAKKKAADDAAAKAAAAEAQRIADAKAKADADAKAAEELKAKAAAAEGHERNSAILAGIVQLQHSVDGDWTEAGLPSVVRVSELSGISDVSRADLTSLAPDFKRQAASPAATSTETAVKAPASKAKGSDDLSGARVRATGKGYYGGRIIKPGEEIPSYTGKKAAWFDVIKA